ncbi:MAG: fluoride efflux transporter CrcB [Acidimicrobiaceae bacterium]|nr:fluoride efflux transporter CrcB [Acidimicrobiaceae bacterium]
MDIRTFLFVAIGGMTGAVSRWGLLEILPDNNSWPWQIFIVNMIGSCILGVIVSKPFQRLSPRSISALATGLCGSFTTFSMFSLDLAELIRSNQISIALTYLGLSVIGGLILFLLSKSFFNQVGISK